MTMVAACRFRDGALIIADSRATWDRGKRQSFQDALQKILPLGPKISLSFAGDVKAAALIVNQLRLRIKKKARLGNLRKLAAEIPRVAKHYYGLYLAKTRSREGLALILGGVDASGNIGIWCYESPLFRSRNLVHGFEVLGTGAVVKSYIQECWDNLEKELSDLKARADRLLLGLEGELEKRRINTVGGMLQVILIDSGGIRPLRHGFLTLDPEGTAHAKSIDMTAGRWIQRDDARGSEVPLVEPIELIRSGPLEGRFYDFELRSSESRIPKWHLTYFFTCLNVRKGTGTIEFAGLATAFASYGYPISVQLLAAVGLWGSPGDQQIEFKLIREGERKTIHKESIHLEFLPDELDLAIPIALDVAGPGPAFLECYISNQLLGRRALHFGRIPNPPTTEQHKLIEFERELQGRLLEEQRACQDPELESSGKSQLVYLSICQSCVVENSYLKFNGQFVAAYWKSYPLKLRLFIASGFRMPKGDHVLRVDLVDVATREVSPIGSKAVISNSSCIIEPIHAELITVVPKPGVYFVNAYVDEEMVGSTVIAAETEKPRYSYDLPAKDLATVASGELLLLLKRSQRAE